MKLVNTGRSKAFLTAITLIVASAGMAWGAGKQEAQYPAKPIELIVSFSAGGGTDLVGRALAESLKGILKQEVVVVNKTGGGGSVGMLEGLNAKPDGYTLTFFTREVVSLPILGQAPFKTFDFRFIGNVNVDPPLVVVNSKSKYKKIEDLLADIRANPEKLNFAASVVPNFYGIALAQAGNLKFTTVPFLGAAPAITEVVAGRSDFGIYAPGESKAQIDAGNLIPLAVMSEKRFEGYKDVRTFKEIGIDVVSGTYRGVAVNPKTPENVCKILEDAVAQAVKDPKFVEFMNRSFLGIGYRSPEDTKKYIENDIKVLEPIISTAKK